MSVSALRATAFAASLAIALAPPCQAGEVLELARSYETTIAIAGAALPDHGVARARPGSADHELLDLGLPAEADLDALHQLADGSWLVSVDATTTIDGIVVDPAMIVRIDGGSASIEADLRAAGVPPGANVDALTMDGTALLLSFDITVALDGQTVGHDRLVRYDGVTFSAEPALAPAAPDLVAAHRLDDGRTLVAFATPGRIGGVDFDGRDVLLHDPDAGSWQLLERTDATLDALSARVLGDAIFQDGFEGV
jgi:hypothetical protein